LIDTDLQTGAVPLNKHTNIKIRFKDKIEVVTNNIIGYLPGVDAELSQEYLVIGAHYDHEGKSEEGIFLGADDNASGVAGLLELAQAFSQSPSKPKRSILFIAFTAEEKGLLGSAYYTSHPLLPLNKAIAMINMDEIGRNGAGTFKEMNAPDLETTGSNYLMVLYSAQTPLLEALNKEANREIGLDLDFDPNINFSSSGNSDQTNFHNAGIPSLFYFTGFHPDYSRPSDTPDKINYQKMTSIINLIYNVSEELLNAQIRPTFDNSIKSVPKKPRMTF
jgi:Zn-dependent M28 family amino/carboxypeptidase